MSLPQRYTPLPRIQDPSVSVVVPVYNEEKVLPRLVPQLHGLEEAGCQVVLVDGGSTDGTRGALQAEGLRVVGSSKGRARQMNAGAAATTGDVVFFLHADSVLPPDPLGQIRRVMRRHDAGCFGIRFEAKNPVLKLCSWMSNARVWARNIAFGDQGMFMRRELFQQMGGFPDLPIMEDYQLSLDLRSKGVRIGLAPCRITTSSRRFGTDTRTMFKNWRAMTPLRRMYREGVDIQVVAALYRDIR